MFSFSSRICHKALSINREFPKPLLEVNGKTILDYLLDDIDELKKINEYIIVSNHKYINHFKKWKEKKQLSSPITIIDDGTISNDERLGAVSDIDLVIKTLHINEELLVIAGDNLLDFSLRDFINFYDKKKHTVIMRYYEENKEKIKKSACVVVDKDDLVLEMIEKPTSPTSNWCVPPFYIYTKEDTKKVSDALKNGCVKDSPGSFIAYLYKESNVYAMEMKGKRFDIGTLDNYKEVQKNYKGKKDNV